MGLTDEEKTPTPELEYTYFVSFSFIESGMTGIAILNTDIQAIKPIETYADIQRLEALIKRSLSEKCDDCHISIINFKLLSVKVP